LTGQHFDASFPAIFKITSLDQQRNWNAVFSSKISLSITQNNFPISFLRRILVGLFSFNLVRFEWKEICLDFLDTGFGCYDGITGGE
jgi:hypothetical protein